MPTDKQRLDWLTGQEQINFQGTWPEGSIGRAKRLKQIIWWKFRNTEDFHCENRKSFRQAIDAAMREQGRKAVQPSRGEGA